MMGLKTKHIFLFSPASFYMIAMMCSMPLHKAQALATFTVRYASVEQDEKRGFYSQQPQVEVGGNNALTLGEQRQRAFEKVLQLIAFTIDSPIDIKVCPVFSSFGGSLNSATLATGAASFYFTDFIGAPVPHILYPSALADKLANKDLIGEAGGCDLDVLINEDVDTPNVLGDIGFYYGFNKAAGFHVDFISVTLHELSHALGFLSLIDYRGAFSIVDSTGQGYADTFSRYLEHHTSSNLMLFEKAEDTIRAAAMVDESHVHWVGEAGLIASNNLLQGKQDQHVLIYAPKSYERGSSLSHFDHTLRPAQLMAAHYLAPQHSLDLGAAVLSDIGWGDLVDLVLTHTVSYADLIASVKITIKNKGPRDAQHVLFSHYFSEALLLSVKSVNNEPSIMPEACHLSDEAKEVSCDLGTLKAGEEVSFNIEYSTTQAGFEGLNHFYGVTSKGVDQHAEDNFSDEGMSHVTSNPSVAASVTNNTEDNLSFNDHHLSGEVKKAGGGLNHFFLIILMGYYFLVGFMRGPKKFPD